jgi:hypothetical protein
MTVDVGAGGQIDLAGASLQALVELKGSVDSLRSEFKRWRDAEDAYQYGVRSIPIEGQGIAGTTDLAIDCGGPENGYTWEIRRLAIAGPSPETSLGSEIAFVYQSPLKPHTTSGATSMNWVDWTGYNSGKIPSVAFYSAYQIVLVWPAHLWVVINGGTNGQQYVVAGRALNTPDVRRTEVEVL